MASSIDNVFFNNITGGTILFGDVSYSTITCSKTVNDSGTNTKDIFSVLNNLIHSANVNDDKTDGQPITNTK